MIAYGLLYTLYIFGGLLVFVTLTMGAVWLIAKIDEVSTPAAILLTTFLLCLILGMTVAAMTQPPRCTSGPNFEWELCK